MKKKGIILILFVICLFLAINLFLYKPLKNAGFSIFSPIEKMIWKKGNTISSFLNVKHMKEENITLKKENNILKSRISELEEIEKENLELREMIDLGLNEDFTFIGSNLLSTDFDGGEVLINTGGKDGVVLGMPGITKSGVLIGRVIEVFPDYSRLSLVNQKEFSFSVLIGDTTATSRGLKLELIDKDAEIEVGDMVKTSSIGNIFPKGILIGEIVKLNKNDALSFYEGEMRAYYMNERLFNVYLIKDEK